jgi:predicted GTPase
MKRKKIIIMGAAGRDFQNFNVVYRNDPATEIVAFTATQIPNIEGRKYPATLSGKQYPDGIPIFPEEELIKLIKEKSVDEVVFSYSDVAHEYVMQKASKVMAAGADFKLISPDHSWIKSNKPIVAVCAVRTGCGKSQTSRKIVELLTKAGKRVVAIRHPMPYGDLSKQICQRFASYDDLDLHKCTIEEREEYEPYIDQGLVVYAGVDYEKILREAEKEADIIIWDGGNNDAPFYKPDIFITVLDPLRVGHESKFYPGETNFILADTLVINKYEQATPEDIVTLKESIKSENPNAKLICGASKISIEKAEDVKGKKVLVIEDGPTLTHGGMSYGAGIVAAKEFGAAEVVDPRPYAVGSIKEAYTKYPQLGKLVPALGYYPEQLKELEETIRNTPCDTVLIASPIDIRRVIKIAQPALRVSYRLEEIGSPNLGDILADYL